jgi:hypothetical protein
MSTTPTISASGPIKPMSLPHSLIWQSGRQYHAAIPAQRERSRYLRCPPMKTVGKNKSAVFRGYLLIAHSNRYCRSQCAHPEIDEEKILPSLLPSHSGDANPSNSLPVSPGSPPWYASNPGRPPRMRCRTKAFAKGKNLSWPSADWDDTPAWPTV